MAGGVPEEMLHLRELGLLHLDCPTVSGQPLNRVLDWWARSERRLRLRERLASSNGIDPKEVILSPQSARQRGLSSTVTFPRGNLAPEGSVIKSTAIDPSLIDADGVYRKTVPARVFSRENDAKCGIHLTQVTPRCSMCLRGGLSTRPARVRGTLRQRRGLSRLSVRVALAGGFPLSGMRAERAWPVRKVWFECARCGRQTSVTSGTIFQDTRKPLRLWFRAIWHVTSQKNGVSALGLQRVLGLGSYQTAWTWMHKLRRAIGGRSRGR